MNTDLGTIHQSPRVSARRASDREAVSIAGRRLSWGAVFAGVALALGVQVVLALLGAGIGLSAVDPAGDGVPDAQTFGLSAAVWWGVSMLIALFVGGWVAGHMAGIPQQADGVLHGLVVWALTVLLMLYLLTSSIGSMIGGAFSVMGSVAGQSTQAAAAAGPEAVESLLNKAREAGLPVDALKSGSAMTEQQKAEAAQKGRAAADQAAEAGSQAGIWGAIALLLGGIAAAIGGAMGRPRGVVVRT